MYARAAGIRALVFAVTAIAAASCGSNSPTSPGGGGGVFITSVRPDAPIRSVVSQPIIIEGQGFLAGLSVLVTQPDGAQAVYAGADILNRQPTSIQVMVRLALAGAYTFVVQNPSGTSSFPFGVRVVETMTTPVIVNAIPDTLARSVVPQIVRLEGMNFTQDLTLTIVGPDGSFRVMTGAQLSLVTSTTVQFSLLFDRAGRYSISITAPTGEVSNIVAITAT
jgi:hypothetical protein